MNKIDELAEQIRNRWTGPKEELVDKEEALQKALEEFAASLPPTNQTSPSNDAIFSVMRIALEERMLAEAMITAPEDFIGEYAYTDEDEVYDAIEDLCDHVSNCLDVAGALLLG